MRSIRFSYGYNKGKGRRPTAKSSLSKVVQLSRAAFWRMGYRTHLVPDSGCASCINKVGNCPVHLTTLCKGHCPATQGQVRRCKNRCYSFATYASVTLMLSTSTRLYKYFKIWNIADIPNTNGRLNLDL